MAGSFGYEKEHYELSNKIGNLVLFPEIRNSGRDVGSQLPEQAAGTISRMEQEGSPGIRLKYSLKRLNKDFKIVRIIQNRKFFTEV